MTFTTKDLGNGNAFFLYVDGSFYGMVLKDDEKNRFNIHIKDDAGNMPEAPTYWETSLSEAFKSAERLYWGLDMDEEAE